MPLWVFALVTGDCFFERARKTSPISFGKLWMLANDCIHSWLVTWGRAPPNSKYNWLQVRLSRWGEICSSPPQFWYNGRLPFNKGFCRGGGGTFQGGGTPPPGTFESDQPILARSWSYPKSFRIWGFQTGVASKFQGFWLKLTQLGEIFVQSWKLGSEFGILTGIHKGAPLYTNSTATTEPFKLNSKFKLNRLDQERYSLVASKILREGTK